MASGVSDYGASTWLAALFAVVDLPASYYVALTSVEPGAAMDGDILADIEPSVGIGYARQPYGTGPGAWGINGSYLANTDPIAFPTPGDDWGDLTHYALCTDASGGQIYAWGQLLNPQYVDATTSVIIPAGSVIIALSALANQIAA